jgi:hypothetical protein
MATEESTTVIGTAVPDETLLSILGEGIHTGLRKGSDAPSADKLWQVISDSEDSAWGDALAFALWGLRKMGYDIVKVTT